MYLKNLVAQFFTDKTCLHDYLKRSHKVPDLLNHPCMEISQEMSSKSGIWCLSVMMSFKYGNYDIVYV
jgi:hypothetical protein